MIGNYQELVTSEYRQSPKFMALVKLLTDAIEANRLIIESLPTKFDVDVAVGEQLDQVS